MCTDTTYRNGCGFSITGFVQLHEVPSSEVIRESTWVTRILLRVHGSLRSGWPRRKIRTAWLPYDQSRCAGTAPNPARKHDRTGHLPALFASTSHIQRVSGEVLRRESTSIPSCLYTEWDVN